MKTSSGLIAYVKSQIGLPYWYGTFGQIASNNLYNSKRKQYSNYYRDNDYDKQYGLRVHDCVGLIKGYLWSDSSTSVPRYKASEDVSASGMYNKSTIKGSMNTFPYTNGTLVYKKSNNRIVHVGVYCDDGYVYEAKGHRYGVVKTLFNKKDWNLWSLCPYINYDNKCKKTNEQIANEVIQGLWGNGDNRRKLLKKAGYNYDKIQSIVNSRY